MISNETLEKLARQYQTSTYPNIIREYFQHIFLSELYKLSEAEKLLFKGGTALRIVYGSPRFSEDLDFSLLIGPHQRMKEFVEGLFIRALAEMEKMGMKVELSAKSDTTKEGYYGMATFTAFDYQPVAVEINISSRDEAAVGEVDSIANDFVPTYTLVHLSQNQLVNEKIFGALRERKKPRDFYDLYFIMRKGLLSNEQKKNLAQCKNEIISDTKNIDFQGELGAFLPVGQQSIVREFVRALESELNRQIA